MNLVEPHCSSLRGLQGSHTGFKAAQGCALKEVSQAGGQDDMASDAGKIALVGGLAVVTTTVTAVNAFTKLFDFAPFWSDVLVSIGTLATAVYLFSRASLSRIVIISDPIFNKLIRAGATYLVPAFIAVLSITTAIRPIENAVDGPWYVCGQVLAHCDAPKCIKLYDDRERAASRQCFDLEDSNYFKTPKMGRWNYRPANLSLRCGQVETPVIPLQGVLLNNSKCDGRMRLQ